MTVTFEDAVFIPHPAMCSNHVAQAFHSVVKSGSHTEPLWNAVQSENTEHLDTSYHQLNQWDVIAETS